MSPGFALPYVPDHILGGNAGIGGKAWDISVRPYYQTAMRDVAGIGPIPVAPRIDGFFVLDASAELRVLEKVDFYLQLGNVTNNAYVVSLRPYGLRPGAPFTAVAGVKLRALP